MVRRFPVPDLTPEGGPIRLSSAIARHLHVLRLSTGDSVRLFDGSGHEADARIVELGHDFATAEAAPWESTTQPEAQVILVQCLPKGNKLESVIRSTTEIGVAAIHLAMSTRSVSSHTSSSKLERLTRIATQAARQSQRSTIPDLHPPRPLFDVVAEAPPHASRWVCAPGADAPPAATTSFELWLIVGPEGGLAAEELARLQPLGWTEVQLAPTVLRVETAAPVAVAFGLDRTRSSNR